MENKMECPYKTDCRTLNNNRLYSSAYRARVRETCDTEKYLTCPAYELLDKQKTKQTHTEEVKPKQSSDSLENKTLAEELIQSLFRKK